MNRIEKLKVFRKKGKRIGWVVYLIFILFSLLVQYRTVELLVIVNIYGAIGMYAYKRSFNKTIAFLKKNKEYNTKPTTLELAKHIEIIDTVIINYKMYEIVDMKKYDTFSIGHFYGTGGLTLYCRLSTDKKIRDFISINGFLSNKELENYIRKHNLGYIY